MQTIFSERKAEREREHSRHAASLRQLEHSLNSRERMYKERILGLEEQVRIFRRPDNEEEILTSESDLCVSIV